MSVFPKPKIVDRRRKALGYPGHGVYPKRPLSAIKNIVWHYTATTHAGDAENIIAAHESYWRNHHGWDIGGYAYYIDRQGKIVQNYDLEVVTYGAGIANPYCLHISLEASDENNYTPAQIKSREELTLWLLTGALKHLGGSSMRGHKEMPGNSTSCPGYSISKLNALRSDLTKKLASKNWVDTTPAQISTKVKGNKYVVKHGDTLWAISKAFGVSLDQLREWNGIKEGQWLKTGQTVYVKAPTAYNTYTVVKGDYLYKIATKYGVTVAEIKEWNDLETNLISVGQELLIAKPLQIIDKKDEPKKPVEPKQETEPIKQVEDKGAKTPALEFGPGEHLEIHKDGKVYVVKNK